MVVNAINSTKAVSGTEGNKKSNVSGTKFQTVLNENTTKNETTSVSLNDIFERASKKYNVPVNLLKSIGYCESSFNPNATSHCGAQGIMQLMPATARELGVADAYDPEQNIMGGAKYISGLLKKYDGNTTLALAAYNAGSGNVAKYGGVPPFKETQNYVVKVQKYMNQEIDCDKKVTVKNSSMNTAVSNVNTTNNTTYEPIFIQVSEEELATTKDNLDLIFSYEDYERFLKILLDDENKKEDNALGQINITPAVAKLLASGN